jgi:hypothetical protein
MPKKAHRKLTAAAKKKGLGGERKKAYVYGVLKRIERGKKRRA